MKFVGWILYHVLSYFWFCSSGHCDRLMVTVNTYQERLIIFKVNRIRMFYCAITHSLLPERDKNSQVLVFVPCIDLFYHLEKNSGFFSFAGSPNSEILCSLFTEEAIISSVTEDILFFFFWNWYDKKLRHLFILCLFLVSSILESVWVWVSLCLIPTSRK